MGTLLMPCLAPAASVQRSKEFHSGTGRDGIFAKSRDPGIFRDGICLIFLSRDFLEIVWDFSGYFCLIRLVINLNIFHEQESPTNIFSIRKTDQLIVGERICKDLHMPYRNF